METPSYVQLIGINTLENIIKRKDKLNWYLQETEIRDGKKVVDATRKCIYTLINSFGLTRHGYLF